MMKASLKAVSLSVPEGEHITGKVIKVKCVAPVCTALFENECTVLCNELYWTETMKRKRQYAQLVYTM